MMLRTHRPAFTLVELLLVITMMGILTSMGLKGWGDLAHAARVARASAEIHGLQIDIAQFHVRNDRYPTSLAEMNRELVDPWGNPYVYKLLAVGGTGSGKGKGVGSIASEARKDRFLVPLNSDFDLYSKGRDGESRLPLTAAASRDDVLRAGDGAYIGLASEF